MFSIDIADCPIGWENNTHGARPQNGDSMTAARRKIIAVCFALVAIVGSGVSIVNYVLESREATSPPQSLGNVAPRAARLAPAKPRDATHDAEQDAAIETAFRSSLRWTPLPAFLDELDRDASGNVWFSVKPVDGMFTLDDFRRSIENAARHKSRIIRGGKILLVDRNGRYWCLADADKSSIRCFDGTRWMEDHPSIAPAASNGSKASNEKTPPKHYLRTIDFWPVALQTRAGDVCFVAEGILDPNVTLHRYSAVGVWSSVSVSANAGYSDPPVMMEQPGDRVAVCTAFRGRIGWGNEAIKVQQERQADKVPHAREHIQSVLIFDQSSCAEYKPVDLPSEETWVDGVVALPDGSVITRYEEGEKDTIAWPSKLNKNLEQHAQKLVDQLADPDAGVRETAMAKLLALGPPVREIVNKALTSMGEDSSVEQKSRLQTIANLIAAQPLGDARIDKALIGGRYQTSNSGVVSRAFDGRIRLYADECLDRVNNAPIGPCYLTVGSDEIWHSQPLPARDYDKYWIASSLSGAYEDVTGTLWCHPPGQPIGWCDYAIEPDFRTHPAGGPGFRTEYIRGSDRDGLVFFFTPNGWMMFNRSVPETSGDLPIKRVNAECMAWLRGQPSAWARNGTPIEIRDDGTTQRMSTPGNFAASHLFPLLHGAVIAWLHPRDAGLVDADRPSLWDGKQWIDNRAGGDMRDFIRAQPDEFMKLAPHTFAACSDEENHFWNLGSDRGQGLWLRTWYLDWDRTTGYSSHVRLEYYDGVQWHDVWELLREPAPATQPDADDEALRVLQQAPETATELLGTVDDGHTLLVSAGSLHKLFGISYEHGVLQKREIADLRGMKNPRLDKIELSQKHVWLFGGDVKNGNLFELKKDTLIALEYAGLPTLADSRDRLWCIAPGMVNVITDDGRASLHVGNVDRLARITESPDGRIWLLDAIELSELAIKESAGKLTLNVKGQWKWSSPKNFFDTYCDAAGGLWLNGVGGEIGRIQLPPRQD
jgi:hypothetical protein